MHACGVLVPRLFVLADGKLGTSSPTVMAASTPSSETQLDFEKQVFVELLSEDGLVILARHVYPVEASGSPWNRLMMDSLTNGLFHLLN